MNFLVPVLRTHQLVALAMTGLMLLLGTLVLVRTGRACLVYLCLFLMHAWVLEITKAPPVGASFNTSPSEPGVIGGGVRGGGILVGLFGYPRSGAKPSLPRGPVLG